MTKFIYQIDKQIQPDKLQEHLDFRGESGWELVVFEFIVGDKSLFMIFKHKVEED